MYQAGIKNITLYENKSITFTFWDPDNLQAITNINGGGDIIQITNKQRPEHEIDIEMSKSGNLVFDYKLTFLLLGLTVENYNLIEDISKSIYGWCALVEYYDGTKKFFNSPIYLPEAEIKPHDEMSFELQMKSKVPAIDKYYEYTANVSTVPVYRADTTLLTADTEIYTADYAL